MTSAGVTRTLLWIVTVTLLLWEGHTLFNREQGDTISEIIRGWNTKSGGLVAWILAALWVHWFLPLPTWWK